MEKAIFTEPGSPIRFDPAQGPPAKAGHMEHHAAPEWETQCLHSVSLFELVSFYVTELEVFRHYKQGQHTWKCCEWCNCASPGECGYIEIHAKISQI